MERLHLSKIILMSLLKTNSFAETLSMKGLHILFFIVMIALSSCTACNEEANTDAVTTSNPLKLVEDPYANRERLNSEQVERIVASLDTFFFYLNEGKFEDHLRMMYPLVWEDDQSLVSYAEYLNELKEGGLINYSDGHELNYVSPVVLDTISGNELVFIEFQSKMRVYVDEKAYPDGLSIEGGIRTRYGNDNYRWDERERTYHIDAPSKMYVFINDDRTAFSFLSEQYLYSPKLAGLLGYYTVRELKMLDKDRP